jgi:two-component system NarL family sensor kinase
LPGKRPNPPAEPAARRRRGPTPAPHGPSLTPPGADPMRQVVDRVRQITVENERLFQELIAGERRFRRLARSVWSVQEAERRRLARELHDGIGQTLTALKQQIELVVVQAADTVPAPAAARLADAAELAKTALRETRELSHLLRPQILDDLGLGPALRWLGRTFQERTGTTVALETAGLERRLPAEHETLAFRIVQEALNNVAKHAQAAGVAVHVALAGGELTLRVEDDGCGFDPRALGHDGSGLRGMRDRVELFGGRIDIASRPGRGTRIAASVPCRPLEEGQDDPGPGS